MSGSSKSTSALRVLAIGSTIVVVGTAGFYHMERLLPRDTKGDRWVNAFYCAASTLTTIGFGDICPGETTYMEQLFLVVYALLGLGFFGGPVMSLAGSWVNYFPGGLATVGTVAIGLGVGIFMQVEGLAEQEAMYAAFIAGTTIGYGDKTPATDNGKMAVALYSIISIPVVASLLVPAREILESLCHVEVVPKISRKAQAARTKLKNQSQKKAKTS